MTSDLQRCLKTNWGHERFRPNQREVIEAAMAGRDTFVLMATGSGKSICYQLPAVMHPRGLGGIGPVTLVVSPLISLMEDQVLSLRNNGISACLVGGSSDLKTEERATRGEFPLVFITPEKVSMWDRGLQAMKAGPGLALFAVDESHCVAEWGHDFRPSYLELRSLREKYPQVPIMALTATATPRVQSEIISNLKLRDPLVAKTSFNRWNLHYSVKPVDTQGRHEALSSLLKNLDGSAIVYVLTKKDAEQLAYDVGRIVSSKGAKAYHGGMSNEQRRAVHHAFVRDEVQVVVATIAFGMGIDKPDVRAVIHCGLPKTVEAYYQQTGRAGRDGLPSKCVLLFSRGDAIRQRRIMAMDTGGAPATPDFIERSSKQLAEMEKLASGAGCLRRAVLKHFGEDMGNAKCDGCDNCDRAAAAAATNASGVAASQEDVDFFTGPAKLVLQAVQDSGGRFGMTVAISFLMGTKAGRDKVPNAASKRSFGKGKEKGKNEAFWKALFYQLVERQGFLEAVTFTSASNGTSGSTYRLSPEGRKFLHNEKEKLPLSFIPSDALAAEGRRLRASSSSPAGDRGAHPQSQAARDGLSEAERKVHALLMEMRASVSADAGVAPYNIIGGQVVRELAKRRPVDLATLSTVEGMSEKKVSDYGLQIIKVVSKACEDLKLETNVAAVPTEEKAWLTTRNSSNSSRPANRENKPPTTTQRLTYDEYTRRGSLTLEEVARTRGLKLGAVAGHLAACLDGGLTFEWDRRRLVIDPALEAKIMGIVEHFKKEGHDLQDPKFRMKPIFEELPPDTDQNMGYNAIRLILARVRYESAGGRLPGSGGQVLRAPSSSAASGKKRALPSYAPTAPSSAKKTFSTKAASSPVLPSPAASKSLFTPSYTPSPPQSSASKASPTATRAAPSSASSTNALSPSVAPTAAASPASVTGRLSTPSSGGTAPVADAFDVSEDSSEPWSSDMVMRMIKEAGSAGATFESMVARNPREEAALRTLLDSLQEDFVVFTKPAETSGGSPVFLAL